MSDKSTKKADDDDIEMSLEPTSEVKRPAASSGKEAKETKEVKDAADGKEAKPSGKEAKTDEGREVKVQEEVKGLDIDENQSYTLVSSNKAKFTVPARFIKQSDLLISMVEGDRDETELPLPRASEPALARVVEYMKHHDEPTFAVAGQPKPEGKAKPIAKPLKSNKFNEYVSDWDYKFVTKLFEDGQELYFDVVLVANYMSIAELLQLLIGYVASTMKGKDPEAIRKLYGIINDFSKEEEKAIREKNSWAART